MAAVIGILGENTAVAAATVTVYTVPASKAAKIRVLFGIEGSGSAWSYDILIGTPGSEQTIHREVASGGDVFSGMEAGGSIVSNTIGIVDNGATLDLDGAIDQLILPYPHDFFLSTGDTVRYIISDAAVDHLFQVIGVEDDA